jgi:hypothetical protein
MPKAGYFSFLFKPGTPRSETKKGVIFLYIELYKNQGKEYYALERKAAKQGISRNALQAASRTIRIEKDRFGFGEDGSTIWSWPAGLDP